MTDGGDETRKEEREREKNGGWVREEWAITHQSFTLYVSFFNPRDNVEWFVRNSRRLTAQADSH